jgi:hypothetical protein
MRRMIGCGHPQLIRLLLDPEPAEGSGGGGTAPQASPPARERSPLSEDQVREIIRQEGTPEKAFLKLDRRNRKHLAEAVSRAELAERKLKDAEAKVPGPGSVVLSKEDAAVWAKVQEHELTDPDAVRKRLEAGDEAIGKVAKSARDAELAAVAEVIRIPADRLATFATLAADRRFEVVEEGDEGRKVKKAYVLEGEGKDQKKVEATLALKDHAAALGIGTAQQQQPRRPASAAGMRPSANLPPAQDGQQQVSGQHVMQPEGRPVTYF